MKSRIRWVLMIVAIIALVGCSEATADKSVSDDVITKIADIEVESIQEYGRRYLGISDDGTQMAFLEKDSNTVTVINTDDNSEVAKVDTEIYKKMNMYYLNNDYAVWSPNGDYLLITNKNDNDPFNYVHRIQADLSVIDIKNNKLIKLIDVEYRERAEVGIDIRYGYRWNADNTLNYVEHKSDRFDINNIDLEGNIERLYSISSSEQKTILSFMPYEDRLIISVDNWSMDGKDEVIDYDKKSKISSTIFSSSSKSMNYISGLKNNNILIATKTIDKQNGKFEHKYNLLKYNKDTDNFSTINVPFVSEVNNARLCIDGINVVGVKSDNSKDIKVDTIYVYNTTTSELNRKDFAKEDLGRKGLMSVDRITDDYRLYEGNKYNNTIVFLLNRNEQK